MRQSREYTVNVINASQAILPHNPRRRALIITTDTNTIYLSEQTPVTSGHGIQIPTGIQPFRVCCRDTGEWICRQLYAISPGGATTVCILEVLADPDGDIDDSKRSEYRGTY